MGNAVKQQPTVVNSTSDSASEAKKTRTPPPPPAPEGKPCINKTGFLSIPEPDRTRVVRFLQ